ncbi:MAG: glucokinase [Pseudomonadota bacterium]
MIEPDLVADIGGTHARFALSDGMCLRDVQVIKHRDVGSFDEALRQYLTARAISPRRACLALATPITGDTVALTNSDWVLSRDQLLQGFGFDTVELVNDFTALANALPHLTPADLRQFGGSDSDPRGPRALLGAGTGLGVSGLITSPSGQTVALAGEGGHVSVPQGDTVDQHVVTRLVSVFGRVSLERILSGDGLRNVHWALAPDHTETLEEQPDAADISRRAQHAADPRAEQTLRVFTRMLGSYAGDLALILGATGGVYIGGGIAAAIVDSLEHWGLRQAFENKGRMARVVAPIPLYVIKHPHPGLLGAAMSLPRLEHTA